VSDSDAMPRDQPRDELCGGAAAVVRIEPRRERKQEEQAVRTDYLGSLRAGKRITSRIESRPVSSIVSLSIPIPQPPVGGMP
jgi:hypothetical protein